MIAKDTERATLKDSILNKVWSYTMNGWPCYLQDEALQPYFIRRQELTAEQGCVLWGQRVIIPPAFRQRLLEDLHHVQYFLVLIDSHSKWLEVFPMLSITPQNTIVVLQRLFAAYGLPEELVLDNGPELVSREFTQFLEKNGIKHTPVPAYHPASNGAAERSVQIVKRALIKDGKGSLPLSHRVANFLLMYRSTPHTVTGRTPAELFLKCQMRTRFSLLKPELARRTEEKQAMQKHHHDRGGSSILFLPGR